MTDAANPEVLLFASTTQSFLEKEASLSRLRELHAAGWEIDHGPRVLRRRHDVARTLHTDSKGKVHARRRRSQRWDPSNQGAILPDDRF